MRHYLAFSLLAVLFATACPSCPGVDNLEGNRKKIAVDVCTAAPNINIKGVVDACNLDFGQASLSERTTRDVVLSNVGELDLKISGYKFTDASDPSIMVEHFPDVIKTG